jgi:DNA polymerase I-like protein with 3'-5' exonuclease and polymerase domains
MVYEKLNKELAADPALIRMFDKVVMPAYWAVTRMEQDGMPINLKVLDKLEIEYKAAKGKAEEALNNYAQIDWNSPKQVGKYLYEDLKLPVMRKTKPSDTFPDGQPSTDDDALWLLRGQHPIVEALQTYRKEKKRVETVQSLRDGVGVDGRLHSNFVIAGPSSGRTSSRDPNVQNLQRGKGIRDFIEAGPGMALVEGDLSLIEMRWGAYIYSEPTLLRLLKEGKDLHRYTASLAFGKEEDAITPKERQLGKTTNFLLLYGGGADRLSTELRSTGMTKAEAIQVLQAMGKTVNVDDPISLVAYALWQAFHRAYPRLKPAHAAIADDIHREKYVRSIFGRIQRLPEIDAMKRMHSDHAARVGINMVVQGPASDTCLLALIKVVNDIAPKYGAKTIDTVHDAILAEVPEAQAHDFAVALKEVMEHPPLRDFDIVMPIPILAEIKSGKSWGSLSEGLPQVSAVLAADPLDEPRQPSGDGRVNGGEEDTGNRPEKSEPHGLENHPSSPPAQETLEILGAAQLYVNRGWSVIPIHTLGKDPSLPGWKQFQERRATNEELAQWFGQGNVARNNLAIIAGTVSKILVVDIDANRGGNVWLAEKNLSSSYIVRTGGGGRHLYFQHYGEPLKNSVNLAPGVDIRAEGGYVVAPPSMHASGLRYEWEGGVPWGEMPLPPAWLIELIRKREIPEQVDPITGEGRAIPAERIPEIVNFLVPFVQEGQRHAFHMAIHGFLAKRNFRKEDLREIISRLMVATGDEEIEDRLRLLDDTYERARNGDVVAGAAALVDLIGKPNLDAMFMRFGTISEGKTRDVACMDDLGAEPIPAQHWLVEQLLPEGGLFMLSGHPGTGKTTLALQICMQIAAGRPVLGRFNVPKPFKVLYYQADNPPIMMKKLVKHMRPKLPMAGQNLWIANVKEPIKLNNGGFDIIVQDIDQYKPDLLMFDTIRDFHTADENNPTAVAETIDTLKRLRGRRNTSIGYIHHHSKSTEGYQRLAVEAHMGSMRFVTPVDLSMALLWNPIANTKTSVKLIFSKVRWGPAVEDIYLKRDIVDPWYNDAGAHERPQGA